VRAEPVGENEITRSESTSTAPMSRRCRRPGSHLHPTGRYSHHADHVRAALGAAGFVAIEQNDAGIRNEGNAPVIGLIVSARREG
jgi:predicted TPR repeat methyltransferase